MTYRTTTRRKFIFALSAMLAAIFPCTLTARNVDCGREFGVLSFEDGVGNVTASKGSKLSISEEHCKLGEHSLEWQWKGKGSEMAIHERVRYLSKNPNPRETSISSFVFWVYSPAPIEGKLTFVFKKDGEECCWFDYGLGFTGWRGAWVAFDRDMKGTPLENMDEIIVRAPESVKSGTLFFDGIIPASFQDSRYHTADWQAPFINPNTTSHWLVLNRSWKEKLDITPENTLTPEEIADMQSIEGRFVELVRDSPFPTRNIDNLVSEYESYGIHENPDGTITGKPIYFTRYGETFINLGIKDMSKQFSKNGQLLRDINNLMCRIAVAYSGVSPKSLNGQENRRKLASMYVNLTRHLLDQGFAAGSAQGTLHHLGYSMRNFYTGPVIMKDVLRAAGLDSQVQQAMEWFSGVGEIKTAPTEPGMDIDAFNTSLMGRTASLLMLEDTPYKYAYMRALSRWIDNGLKIADGLRPCFKEDGTVMHHRKAYPAYATGGFDGAVNAVWMLAGTELKVSQESHENLKRALLEMSFYCNLRSFPLAMSGRHPDGLGALIPRQYRKLASAGSPDGEKLTDEELFDTWKRVYGKTPTDINGTRVYPFACAMSHRRGDWLVTIAGHSRYIWETEIYNGANLYGRYLTHGSMQILGDGADEVDSFGSGYQVDGWDWCHIPGTTAAQIPMTGMKARVLNVDKYSGYEEMLLSDEWFAGGVSHKGEHGVFGMILHEHDKYNGSLRARKSWFAFGNRIVALGSDLENSLPGSELHTTLFQNTINDATPTSVGGENIYSLEYGGTLEQPVSVVCDRFGNAFFVKDAKVVVSRGIQHSFHEETAKPTEGTFEKAYIYHGTIVGKGAVAGDIYMKDGYEYLTVIHAKESEKKEYSSRSPYTVLRKDRKCHAVRDLRTGITGASVFETSAVDPLVVRATPSLLMYSCNAEGVVTLSVSNPDLALYRGDSDEVYDADGKRKERSIYGRDWVNNPCGQTSVTVVLSGKWDISDRGKSDVKAVVKGDSTTLTFSTKAARTEEIKLIQKQ